jgi:hypothetical protein
MISSQMQVISRNGPDSPIGMGSKRLLFIGGFSCNNHLLAELINGFHSYSFHNLVDLRLSVDFVNAAGLHCRRSHFHT